MSRCALCPGTYNCVPPSGPTNVEDMYIGEAPGTTEDKAGQPFVGKTGEEVDKTYLPLAGQKREACYFTNSIRCLPNTPKHKLDLKKQSTKDLIDSCAGYHLYKEIAQIQPKLLIPMGAIACHAIDPDINLELHHGMPFKTRLGIMAFPMWHPAGGLHEPKKMLQIRTDWWRLRRYKQGKLLVPKDHFTKPDYKECNGYTDIDEIDPTLPMANDTEWSPSVGPYCLTFSQCPGMARLIRAERTDLLKRFQDKLDRWESILLFHNWLYDKKITWSMKLDFPDRLIRDTMIRSFHLGNLPQALKVACYRELGMNMMDFDDLVLPFSRPLAIDYLKVAKIHTWEKPEESVKLDSKSGMWKLYRPQSFGTKLKRFFTDLDKNEDKDPFDMWDNNWEDSHAIVEEVLGPFPQKDIAHTPFELALIYACKDADSTLRYNEVLESMIRQVRRKPQEQWRNT